MSFIERTSSNLRELKTRRQQLQEGVQLSPDMVAALLDLAIAAIERLLVRRAAWASVSGNYAIDTAGRMWIWADERWNLESEGPPEV